MIDARSNVRVVVALSVRSEESTGRRGVRVAIRTAERSAFAVELVPVFASLVRKGDGELVPVVDVLDESVLGVDDDVEFAVVVVRLWRRREDVRLGVRGVLERHSVGLLIGNVGAVEAELDALAEPVALVAREFGEDVRRESRFRPVRDIVTVLGVVDRRQPR